MICFNFFWSGQEIPGIDLAVVIVQHLEVDVWTAGFPSAADRADRGALENALPADSRDDAHVSVKSLPAVAMVYDDHVPVTEVIPTRVHHDASIRSPQRLAEISLDIDPVVVRRRRIIVAGEEILCARPDESAAAYGPVYHHAARTRADDFGDSGIVAGDPRRAPGNELARPTGDDQEGPRFDVRIGPIPDRFRIEVIGRVINDVFWGDVVSR